MKTAGLKILNNKLSEYLRLAASGETMLVTDRDRVVAELNPPQPGRKDFMSDPFLLRGIRERWLTCRPSAVCFRLLPGRNDLDELMEDLGRDRKIDDLSR